MDYISALEKALKKEAKKNFLDIQPGDVPATWANTTLLKNLTGFTPSTSVDDGVKNFVSWYLDYYKNDL
jgi:UDP-glucuronate 4-epimerase